LYLTFHSRERFRDAPAHDEHAHEQHAPAGHTHAEASVAAAHGDDANAHDDGHDDDHAHHGPVEPRESPLVVTVPLILLAIPSVVIGFLTVKPMLFGDFFAGSIEMLPAHSAMAVLGEEFHSAGAMALHGFLGAPFWLALAGFAMATYLYLINPAMAGRARKFFAWPVRVLENKYWLDDLWIKGFAGGGLGLGKLASSLGDAGLIDGIVNGTAWLIGRIASLVRRLQSGYLYHYAFAMILGLIVLLAMVARMGH